MEDAGGVARVVVGRVHAESARAARGPGPRDRRAVGQRLLDEGGDREIGVGRHVLELARRDAEVELRLELDLHLRRAHLDASVAGGVAVEGGDSDRVRVGRIGVDAGGDVVVGRRAQQAFEVVHAIAADAEQVAVFAGACPVQEHALGRHVRIQPFDLRRHRALAVDAGGRRDRQRIGRERNLRLRHVHRELGQLPRIGPVLDDRAVVADQRTDLDELDDAGQLAERVLQLAEVELAEVAGHQVDGDDVALAVEQLRREVLARGLGVGLQAQLEQALEGVAREELGQEAAERALGVTDFERGDGGREVGAGHRQAREVADAVEHQGPARLLEFRLEGAGDPLADHRQDQGPHERLDDVLDHGLPEDAFERRVLGVAQAAHVVGTDADHPRRVDGHLGRVLRREEQLDRIAPDWLPDRTAGLVVAEKAEVGIELGHVVADRGDQAVEAEQGRRVEIEVLERHRRRLGRQVAGRVVVAGPRNEGMGAAAELVLQQHIVEVGRREQGQAAFGAVGRDRDRLRSGARSGGWHRALPAQRQRRDLQRVHQRGVAGVYAISGRGRLDGQAQRLDHGVEVRVGQRAAQGDLDRRAVVVGLAGEHQQGLRRAARIDRRAHAGLDHAHQDEMPAAVEHVAHLRRAFDDDDTGRAVVAHLRDVVGRDQVGACHDDRAAGRQDDLGRLDRAVDRRQLGGERLGLGLVGIGRDAAARAAVVAVAAAAGDQRQRRGQRQSTGKAEHQLAAQRVGSGQRIGGVVLHGGVLGCRDARSFFRRR